LTVVCPGIGAWILSTLVDRRPLDRASRRHDVGAPSLSPSATRQICPIRQVHIRSAADHLQGWLFLGCLALEEVQRAYAALAEQYIELIRRTEVPADDLALIARHLSIRPGAVLDAGCGPGHLTAHLRSLEVDAFGLDVVRPFIDHARVTHPTGRYVLGSTHQLPILDRSIAGVLAWYSLIHLPPDDLDGALAELRRTLAPAGRLVVGFFDGDEVLAFEHTVVTAYYWPADAFARRLRQAGFTEIERQRRPGVSKPGQRPHAAIAAVAI
jgi:SAM-dependent methyltransferase